MSSDVQASRRIDKGIKRGPRAKPVPPSNGHPNYGKLRTVDPDDMLSAIADGMLVTELARSLGVCQAAISQKLARYNKDDYKQARAIGITANLHASRELLREARYARDPVMLACAREEFRADSWFAERELPEIYGQQVRQNIAVTHTVDLGARLQRAEERVVPGVDLGVSQGVSQHPALPNPEQDQ